MVVGTREGIRPSRGLLTTLAGKKVFESSVALLSKLARNIESMRFGTVSRSTAVSSSFSTSSCVTKMSGLCAVRFFSQSWVFYMDIIRRRVFVSCRGGCTAAVFLEP